jgi:hypothetical protein
VFGAEKERARGRAGKMRNLKYLKTFPFPDSPALAAVNFVVLPAFLASVHGMLLLRDFRQDVECWMEENVFNFFPLPPRHSSYLFFPLFELLGKSLGTLSSYTVTTERAAQEKEY